MGVFHDPVEGSAAAARLRPRSAGAPPPVTAAPALLGLQALAGNQAVTKLVQRRASWGQPDGTSPPAAPVQRLIVNVNGTPLPALDAYNYTAMHEGFQADRGQQAQDFGTADYRKHMAPSDNVYFVGHGSAGTVGYYQPSQIVAALAHPRRGLPMNFSGTIISLSCSTGVSSRGGAVGGSGVKQVAVGLGDAGRGGVRVRGARGAYLTHADVGARAIRPDKVDDAFKYQTKHEGTVKTDFEDWKRLNPSATPLERADEAARLTKAFIQGFINKADRKGWIIDRVRTMKEKTSVAPVAAAKPWYARLLAALGVS